MGRFGTLKTTGRFAEASNAGEEFAITPKLTLVEDVRSTTLLVRVIVGASSAVLSDVA